MYAIIVEDDHLQSGPIRKDLEDAFPGARVETLKTEFEFRERLPRLRDDRPDIMIIDVMLRWADPQPDFPRPPQEVSAEGFYRAGLRCAKLVLDDPILRKVPIILYTILREDEIEREVRKLGDGITYVSKEAAVESLIRLVQHLSTPASS